MAAALRLFAMFLAIAVLVAAPFFIWGDRIEQLFSGTGAIDWLTSHGPYAWLIAIGLLIADLAMPIPTTAVMAALGIVYGPLLGGLISAGGSVLSGLIGYGLCRHLGRPFVLKLFGEQAISDGERLFARSGGWMVVLSRWLPVLSEVIACMAGLSRMRFPIFFSALLCGSVPLGFVFAAIGGAGEDRPAMALGISAVLPILLWLVLRPILRARYLNR